MLLSDGICVHLLRTRTSTDTSPDTYKILPKETHHHQQQALQLGLLHLLWPPVRVRSFSEASPQFLTVNISVRHPWPPHVKLQPVQHSLPRFAALFSSKTPIAICHISWVSLFFLFLGHAVASYFPDQGLNPCSLHWECRGLNHWTTREVPVGYLFTCVFYLLFHSTGM